MSVWKWVKLNLEWEVVKVYLSPVSSEPLWFVIVGDGRNHTPEHYPGLKWGPVISEPSE